jgi:hypothetical protein
MNETSLREDVQGHRQFAGYRLQGLSVGGLASRFDFGKLGFVDANLAGQVHFGKSTMPAKHANGTARGFDLVPDLHGERNVFPALDCGAAFCDYSCRHFVLGGLISSTREQRYVISAAHDHQLFSGIGGEYVWLTHGELLSTVNVLSMADLLNENDSVLLEKDDAIVTRPESQTRPTDERYDVTPTRSDVEFQLCDDVIPDSTSANRVTRQPWLAA